jgi:hypothetical protein
MVRHGRGGGGAGQPVAVKGADDDRAGALRIAGEVIALIAVITIIEVRESPEDRDAQVRQRIERGNQCRAR